MSNEPLLHPPAEVVRTGLPVGAKPAPTPSNTVTEGGGDRRVVAGPFASGPPSTLMIPPGSYVKPTPVVRLASVVVDVPETHSAEADEIAYLELPPEPVGEYPPLAGVRGGRKPRKKAILWEVVRSLRMPEDLPLLSSSLPAAKQTLTQIRHSHHQLAQLLSTGTEQSECSYITGYSPAYISVLKGDPTFQELVAYYTAQREHIFVDAIERMRSLGINTLEVLQSRLEEDDSQFTNRELMEQAELMLIKPMAATRGIIPPGGPRAPDGSGSGVQVNVNFIQTQPREPAPTQGDVIDMKPAAKY